MTTWFCFLLYRLAMTCDQCVGGIIYSLNQLCSEEFVIDIAEWLSGEEFCGLEEDPEMCAAIIEQLIPAALPVLAAGYKEGLLGLMIICEMAVPDTCN